MSQSNKAQRGQSRTKRPERSQVKMQFLSLDEWLDKDHPVRFVWAYAESLDLSDLYARIKAVEGHAGRDAIDPRILFALWLFATIEGVSSARRIEKSTQRDIPYMWLCGEVSVNYHTLSDFRKDHAELLERLMIDSIAVLLQQKLVNLETVAQDGMRVRASAGSDSFRRERTLKDRLAEARAHVAALRAEHEQDASGDHRRQKAAAQRAAQENAERIAAAIEELEKLNASRKQHKTKAKEARASTTDPEARKMKMADGGFRPAFNVQFVSDAESRLIVGVEVTNSGSDAGQMSGMHRSICSNYGRKPKRYLVDGQYATISEVTSVEEDGTEVYAPLVKEQMQLEAGADPYARKKRDTDAMASFRARMGTPAAKAIYKQRPGVAEFPNADCRNRGLQQFRVRGVLKAKAQALWHVLAFNLLRIRNLGYTTAIGIR